MNNENNYLTRIQFQCSFHAFVVKKRNNNLRLHDDKYLIALGGWVCFWPTFFFAAHNVGIP